MISPAEALTALRRALRTRKRTLALLALYAALRVALALTSGDHGLVTPEGRVDLTFGALAVTALALRLATLFIAAPLLAWSLLQELTAAWRRTSPPPGP